MCVASIQDLLGTLDTILSCFQPSEYFFSFQEEVLNNFVEMNKTCQISFQTVCCFHFLPASYRSDYNSKSNGIFTITPLIYEVDCRHFYTFQSSESQSLAPEKQHQHHLRICQRYTLSGPTPNLLIQKIWRWDPAIVDQALQEILMHIKFENHCLTMKNILKGKGTELKVFLRL